MTGGGMTDTNFTIFLIDDDADVREALRLLLRTVGFTVECYPDPLSFLARRDPERPGCLLLDVRMPGMSGLQLLERLTADGDDRPVIVITGHADVNACRRAFKNGAIDFLTKPVDEQALIEAIQTAAARDRAARTAQAEAEEARALLARLTARELEVLDLIARGFSTKDIARLLDLSPRTVDTHRANLSAKLGTSSVAEMVQLALHQDRRLPM
jgi:FixJ family two-component response regulator